MTVFMKLLFIVPRLDKASSRYRVVQYLPFLERLGAECTVVELPSGLIERFRLWVSCQNYSAVVLQKRLLSAWDLFWLSRYCNKLCYDFDDAVMLPDSGKASDSSKTRQKKFSGIVNKADLVVAGNQYLAERARNAGSNNVSVVNTPIDLQRYRVAPELRGGDSVTIGWIGSRATLGYLETVRPALEWLGKKYPNVRLKLISDEFLEFADLNVDCIPWSYEEEIEQLNSIDIGIMPLTDDPWSRGKCGFKLLQYMGVGIPTVCHPVGLNKEIVIDQSTGLCATTGQEWMVALQTLVEDKSMRERFGRKGRERVSALFGVERNAAALFDQLERVC